MSVLADPVFWLAVVAVLIAVVGWTLVLRRRPVVDDTALLLLQRQVEALAGQGQAQMEALRAALQQGHGQMLQTLGSTRQTLDQRLDGTGRMFHQLGEQLGRLDESARSILQVGQEVDRLQRLLRAPKARGRLGELVLEELLAGILPVDAYTFQYRFRDGVIVDAVVRLRTGLVPVDAKFPLDNFRRASEAEEARERASAQRQFERDVRQHIDAIAERYVRPDEGTFDFALMYVAAEGVYHAAFLDEGSQLLRHALHKRVVPVSPGGFYAYLQTVLFGLRGLRLERSAQRVLDDLARLRQEVGQLQDTFRKLSHHLDNAHKQLAEAGRRTERVGTVLERIDQHPVSEPTGSAQEPELAAATGSPPAPTPVPSPVLPTVPPPKLRSWLLWLTLLASVAGAGCRQDAPRHRGIDESASSQRLIDVYQLAWSSTRSVAQEEPTGSDASATDESAKSGVVWRSLEGIYRETLVTRAPEVVTWPLTLPSRAGFEVAVGTLDESPVTFRLSLHRLEVPEDGKPSFQLLAERTVTRRERWHPWQLDLAPWAGERVELRLELIAEEPGTAGLWGAPVVRRRLPESPNLAARAGSASERVEPPRGVVFVLIDTLRPDHLELYGSPRETAPTLTRLAAGGVHFRDVVAQASWTKVSAPSLFTGLYPTSLGVLTLNDKLPYAATTLAEVYRAAGYATYGEAAVPFTGTLSALHQGYEVLAEAPFDPDFSKTARDQVDRLLPWIEAHREVPFFAFLHIFDPHSPYRPAAPYDRRWASVDEFDAHAAASEEIRGHIDHRMRSRIVMPWQQEIDAADVDAEIWLQHRQAWYDGSIRALDEELRRLWQRLHEWGLAESTLVVLTSDHGEEFLEHGRSFHGQGVHAELVQVPWILHYSPLLRAGVTVTETVQLIDVLPTVLELSGLPVPEAVQGRSAVPLLAAAGGLTEAGTVSLAASIGRPWRSLPAISEKPVDPSPAAPPPHDLGALAVAHEGWRLIHYLQNAEGVPEFQLYRRDLDPLEQHNVAAEYPEVVERLTALLDAWQAAAEADKLNDGMPVGTVPQADTGVQMSTEERARLRALGYG